MTLQTFQQDVLSLKRSVSLLFLTALFFWSWAVYNTIARPFGFDLGCISFALVVVACIWLLFGIKLKNMTSQQIYFFVFSSCLVSINYLLGMIRALDDQGGGEGHRDSDNKKRYAIYCGIFSVVWLFLAIFFFRVLKGFRTKYGHSQSQADDYHQIKDMGENLARPNLN